MLGIYKSQEDGITRCDPKRNHKGNTTKVGLKERMKCRTAVWSHNSRVIDICNM